MKPVALGLNPLLSGSVFLTVYLCFDDGDKGYTVSIPSLAGQFF